MTTAATALINIRRSPYQSLAAIALLTLTFFVGYSVSFFLLGSEQVLQYFEARPQVIAFFQVETPNDKVTELASQLQTKTYVESVKIVSKDDALQIYQDENKDDPLLLELVTSQILPASLEVSGKTIDDLKRIKTDLEASTVIDEVILQQDVIDSLSGWTKTIRLIGLAAVAILSLTSLLSMIIVIGMKVVVKRPAITIMRIIGATKWFISSPFVFEGVIYGVVSSLLGWITTYAGLLYLTPWLQSFLGPINVLPVPPAVFMIQVGIGSICGMILGGVAGMIAVSRLIKK
jgi:cell division transport system permease protein